MHSATVLVICGFALLCTISPAHTAASGSKYKIEKQGYSYRAETKGPSQPFPNIEECEDLLGADLVAEIKNYQPIADQIIAATTATDGAFKGRTYAELTKFVDKFGQRLSGSQSLEDSIDYMLEKFEADGYSAAWGEEVIVPHWVRGEESAEMITPRKKKLNILGLGTSVGTSPEGMTAEVLVVRSFEELTANADKAKGKIVVYNQPWVTYGQSGAYRRSGAAKAAEVGAVAALVRSVAPYSLDTPHTGGQNYEDGVPHIPVACITIEDAQLLDRLTTSGENVTIFLKMLDYNLPQTTSRNAIGQLTGQTLPEEYVIVSGHIDSWDVGQGAMDDGGGCLISTEALALIKSLNLPHKRSLQAIMWTSEEPGLWGAEDYARHHEADMSKIIAAFESDAGVFTPVGLDFAGKSEKAGCIIQLILQLTASIQTTQFANYTTVSTDIGHLISRGVPGLSLANDAEDEYFFFHHTEADTMDMIDSDGLDKALALWTVAAYVVADLKDPLPRVED